VKNDLATRVRGNQGIYDDFQYDAQFLYRSRLEAELRNYPDADSFNDALNALLKMLKPFWKRYGEPSAYGVLLLADGDRMGELLDKAQDKKHINKSQLHCQNLQVVWLKRCVNMMDIVFMLGEMMYLVLYHCTELMIVPKP
jgi:hypothetical protein